MSPPDSCNRPGIYYVEVGSFPPTLGIPGPIPVGDNYTLNISSTSATASTPGNDNLYGGTGDDVLIGGHGINLLDGGANTAVGDTANYAAEIVGVNVALDAAGNGSTINFGPTIINDTLVGIENLVGGSDGDLFRLTNSVGRRLDGGPNPVGNSDFATYLTSSSGVALDIDNNAAPDAARDRLFSFENITGSNFADAFVAQGRDRRPNDRRPQRLRRDLLSEHGR